MKKQKSGFTLIELIMYCALIVVFISGAVRFAWDMLYGQTRSINQQIAQQENRFLAIKIAKILLNSQDIVTLTPSELTVINYDQTNTVLSYENQTINLSQNNQPPIPLNSNLASIDSFSFSRLFPENNQSHNIKVEFSLSVKEATTKSQFSVELGGAFNQARQLLPDTSQIIFASSYTQVQNIILTNVGNSTLTLDKIAVWWDPNVPAKQLTAIQIGGGNLEWSGSRSSSSDFFSLNTPLSLGPNTASAVIDYFQFDNSIAATELYFTLGFSDGSFIHSQILLPNAPGISPTVSPTTFPTNYPTPTLTPTPTPIMINSCLQYCLSLTGYTNGVCSQNSVSCSKAGQVHQPGGDIYCTGGAQADTCCCN